MGNRGILHDEDNQINRQWATKAWLTCVLSFGDLRSRKPFSKGTYSELFFLDEATAFAAGHRPCRYCQRARFDQFKAEWILANDSIAGSTQLISEIDSVLHRERVAPGGKKRTYDSTLSELPPGTMVDYENKAHLVCDAGMMTWSFEGYSRSEPVSPHEVVKVLTPCSIVKLFRNGFRPLVHLSADD